VHKQLFAEPTNVEENAMIENLLRIGGYLLLAREAADFMASASDYRENELHKKNVTCAVSGTLIGITAGVALGVLFAPRSGKETREIISNTTSEMIDNLQNELAERRKQVDEYISRKKEEFCSEPEETQEEAAG
jgi:gas vesicle protein